jgi:dTDP-4-amino-4,6-dideoxygalactose transaminase
MISFLDVKAGYTELQSAIDSAIRRVMQSGWYILGSEVEQFEQEYAAWVGAHHCIGVANGLDAISLALRAVGVQAGDEVIVPANTYIATWLAVTHIGAVPIPIDPDPLTRCLDPDRVSTAITNRTKALLPVHLYGHPADVEALSVIARQNGLRMVEDAAQAHGAALNGTRIGSHGDVVAWSFYPGKNLGAYGDAGAVTTSDPNVAHAVRLMRNYGSAVKYVNDVQGVNSRLDPIQAAILRVKLAVLAEWNDRRKVIADLYTRGLERSGLGLPSVAPGVTHAWHLYVVEHPHRDALQKALAGLGVETLIHYPIPPYRQLAYAPMAARSREWPTSERLATEALSLPIGPHISQDQAQFVVESVQEAIRRL